jgi:asparagine synthase (glutamine-hydrolysing)
MCGVAGQVRFDGQSVDPAVVERMCAAQEHRGPDSRGMHRDETSCLGIQRLRVIDLETGDQPILNEDGSIAVVLNGEIYNFAELRRELRARGHRFTTQGDTEVIVHLYEDLGPRCVERLHGMFGLALWDGRRRRLLLARDRVGKKPLFVAERDGVLSFASELGALMQDPEISGEVDLHAIDCYLAYGYVPAPLSAFRGVQKLPPATLLVFEGGVSRTECYWRLDYARKAELPDADVPEAVREALRRAVRRRMVADVPLGAFLSGGIDSSAVVAAMAEASAGPVKTFSIGFDFETHDELPYARRIASEFATDHHELVVRADAVELLPRLVRHYGEPFADSSAIPSFYLAQLARRHVTVALNGDGGDESFAGYQRYTTNVLLARLDCLPAALRRSAAAVAARLPLDGHPASPLGRARRLAIASGREMRDRYLAQAMVFTPDARGALLSDEFSMAIGRSIAEDVLLEPWAAASGESLLDQLLETDVLTYLPGDLLTKMDIATMASSLEARSPMLDHQFMELAASLPADWKARGLRRKRALRAALRGWVPDDILDAPKRGFEVPIAQWLRGGLSSFAREVLLDPGAIERGWFREHAVRELLDRHTSGRDDHGAQIWSLLVLELWQREIVAPRAAGRMELAA